MTIFICLVYQIADHQDQPGKAVTAALVGADSPKEVLLIVFPHPKMIVALHQVTIMNGLTVNLHLLMLAFYKPEGMRRKILIEDHAFPSDRYAVRSLLRVKGVRVIFSRSQ